MISICNELKPLLQASIAEGNRVLSVSNKYSSVKQVIHMEKPMSKNLYAIFSQQHADIEYWSYKGSPHNPADNGFKAILSNEIMVFPGEKPI